MTNETTYSNGTTTFTVKGDYNLPTNYEILAFNAEHNQRIVLGTSRRKTKSVLVKTCAGNETLCDAIEATTGWDALNDEWSYDGKKKVIDFGGGWVVRYGSTIQDKYEVA